MESFRKSACTKIAEKQFSPAKTGAEKKLFCETSDLETMIELKSTDDLSFDDKFVFAEVFYSVFLIMAALLLIGLSEKQIFLLAALEGTWTLVRCAVGYLLNNYNYISVANKYSQTNA